MSEFGIALLKNVALCAKSLEVSMQRQSFLPGLICFYGPAGWGKSFSAAYCAQKYGCFYVECKSTWTKRAILENILREMGLSTEGQIYKLAERIAENLALSGKPLIIDEVDHIVKKSAIELIRDLYEGSGTTILLIGEEYLPQKLKKWERFYSRILEFVPAQPADLSDLIKLIPYYCPGIEISDDLKTEILNIAKGSLRKISVNLARIKEYALSNGLTTVSLKEYPVANLYTGEAPARRII